MSLLHCECDGLKQRGKGRSLRNCGDGLVKYHGLLRMGRLGLLLGILVGTGDLEGRHATFDLIRPVSWFLVVTEVHTSLNLMGLFGVWGLTFWRVRHLQPLQRRRLKAKRLRWRRRRQLRLPPLFWRLSSGKGKFQLVRRLNSIPVSESTWPSNL